MKAEEVLKKVKEYLEDNKEASSLDIQSDSEKIDRITKHLLSALGEVDEDRS